MNRRVTRRPFGHGRGAFTLVEVMVALGLTFILFTGTFSLFLDATQTTARVGADAASSADAANVLHHIMDDTREALWFALPDDTGSKFVYPTGYSLSNFSTSCGGNQIDTAVMLVSPTTLAASVDNTSGTSITVTPVPYARDPNAAASSTVAYIYRADRAGTPNPAAGQYVAWATASSNGTSFRVTRTQKISDIPATTIAPNLVQFVRSTDASRNTLPYQMEVKVVSSYYSTTTNVQTSEETGGGQVSAITGKTVMMRDHELKGTNEPTGTVGVASGNQFQAD